MRSLKKILTLALAGAMALALLTGCGSDKSSATHKSIADEMANYAKGAENNQSITYTASPELDSRLESFATSPNTKAQWAQVVKAVYSNQTSGLSLPSGIIPQGKVVYLYCGKYDTNAGNQAIYLNAHSYCATPSGNRNQSLANDRQIGLITTSFEDNNGKTVKVRFAVVVSAVPSAANP